MHHTTNGIHQANIVYIGTRADASCEDHECNTFCLIGKMGKWENLKFSFGLKLTKLARATNCSFRFAAFLFGDFSCLSKSLTKRQSFIQELKFQGKILPFGNRYWQLHASVLNCNCTVVAWWTFIDKTTKNIQIKRSQNTKKNLTWFLNQPVQISIQCCSMVPQFWTKKNYEAKSHPFEWFQNAWWWLLCLH